MKPKNKALSLIGLLAVIAVATILSMWIFVEIQKHKDNMAERTPSYDNFFTIYDKTPDGCQKHATIYLRNDTEEKRTRIEICRRESGQFYNLVIHNPRGNLPKECLYPGSDFYNQLCNTKNQPNLTKGANP